ncbi:MAG: ABC transporter ATP-binding protein [Bacteroidales bacterium]|nr:ABC transporter ATP-binding protein [Bacteroidales bacterium]
MIEAINLSKSYHGEKVLDIPSLKVARGESFGLVGNNGAGKTTFFRLILDLIRADSGHVLSNQQDVRKSDNWKYTTGSYLDARFLIDYLTPEEYFDFLAHVHGMSDGDLQEFYDGFREFFNGEVLEKRKFIRDFSAGNQQKIGVAAALMMKPGIVILDEPFNSLDPSTQIRLKNILNRMKREHGTTLLISSHDLNHVTEVCDRIVILEKGKIVHDLQTTQTTLQELEQYFAV